MKAYTKEDVIRLNCMMIKQVQKDKSVDVQPDKKLFKDFGLDSIQFVSVIMEFEMQFEIEFDNEIFEKLHDMTVNEISEYIYKRMGERKNA